MPSTVSRSSSMRHSIASVEEYTKRDPRLSTRYTAPTDGMGEHLSPAEAAFAFQDSNNELSQHRKTLQDLVGKRDTPVDSMYWAEKGANPTPTMPVESKSMAQMYEDHFQTRDRGLPTLQEQRDSPVIAHLRTNVIIKDEYTLVTDLSAHLADRYARTDSNIMINVDHSACLMLARSFEPAYILTITAVPSELRPDMNKANAAHIQSFVTGILSVPPERGIIRFEAIQESHLAINGATVAGAGERSSASTRLIDKRHSYNNATTVPWDMSRGGSGSKRNSLRSTERTAKAGPLSSVAILERTDSRRSSVSSIANDEEKSELQNGNGLKTALSPTRLSFEGQPHNGLNGNPVHGNADERKQDHIQHSAPNTGLDWRPAAPSPTIGGGQRVSAQKSVNQPNWSRRDTTNANYGPNKAWNSSPPSPQGKTSKLSKRKSLMAVFRR